MTTVDSKVKDTYVLIGSSGGNVGPLSLHLSFQVLKLSLQSVLCLLGLERDLVDGHSAGLDIAEPHHQNKCVGSSACQTRI